MFESGHEMPMGNDFKNFLQRPAIIEGERRKIQANNPEADPNTLQGLVEKRMKEIETLGEKLAKNSGVFSGEKIMELVNNYEASKGIEEPGMPQPTHDLAKRRNYSTGKDDLWADSEQWQVDEKARKAAAKPEPIGTSKRKAA